MHSLIFLTLLITATLSFSLAISANGEIIIDSGKVDRFIENNMYIELLEYSSDILLSHPNNEEVLVAKAMALYYLDREEESIEFFNKALEINPIN